ncbi:MAG TPA: extracellular solute-binding protein [Xanthobacteraceae bacterium]|nr:extracellular solute-binding protein [Xanthobacteraceae bacterium]
MRSAIPAVAIVACGLGLAFTTVGFGFTPDRPDVEAARREGTVSWYTSTPVAQAQQLASRFEQQTGIKVQLLRSGGQAVLRRLQQEISAGRPGADVLTMSDAGAANGLARQSILEPFRPQGFDKVVEGAKDKEGRWIAQRLQLVGIPVRTDKVAEADRPKTWSDLKHAKYKGLMVMPDPSFTAIQLVVVGMLSQRLGWDFYKALRANDTMVVQGHQQVFSTMQQGERLIGAEGADPRSFFDGKEVPNQAMIYPDEGTFIVSSPTAVLKGARNSNAAKLFAEFMITPEAQTIIAESGIHSSRVDVAPPPGQPALTDVKFLPIDLDFIEEKGRELKTRFGEIFQ